MEVIMNNRGASLLEALVVVAIAAFAASIGVGLWSEAIARYRLQNSACGLMAFLNSARTQAVARNLRIELHLDGERRRYSWSQSGQKPSSWFRLQPGVRIQGRELAFSSRGNAVPAGVFKLTNAAGEIRVVVAPAGRIRQERVR